MSIEKIDKAKAQLSCRLITGIACIASALEAVSALKKAIQLATDDFIVHILLAVTYSMMGREKEARAEAAEVLRINPKFSLDSSVKKNPQKDQSRSDETFNALRKARLK